MSFDSLIATIKMIGPGRQLWLTNETFNELGKQRVRLNRKDNLIVCSDNIEIEISLKDELVSNCITSFAKIERVSEVLGDIYISPKTSEKLSLIL